MKIIVLWLAAAVAVASAMKQEVFQLSKERALHMLNKYAKPCAEEFNVDPDVVNKIADGTLPQDDATKKFVYCFGINGGYINEEGYVHIDRITGIVGDHPLRKELQESIIKCNELKGEDHLATVLLTASCVAHNAPIRFQL